MNKLTVSIPVPSFFSNNNTEETTMQFDPTFVGTSSVKHPISQPNTAALTNKERIMSKIHVPAIVSDRIVAHNKAKELEELKANVISAMTDPFGLHTVDSDKESVITKVTETTVIAASTVAKSTKSLFGTATDKLHVKAVMASFPKKGSRKYARAEKRYNECFIIANLHNNPQFLVVAKHGQK